MTVEINELWSSLSDLTNHQSNAGFKMITLDYFWMHFMKPEHQMAAVLPLCADLFRGKCCHLRKSTLQIFEPVAAFSAQLSH